MSAVIILLSYNDKGILHKILSQLLLELRYLFDQGIACRDKETGHRLYRL